MGKVEKGQVGLGLGFLIHLIHIEFSIFSTAGTAPPAAGTSEEKKRKMSKEQQLTR